MSMVTNFAEILMKHAAQDPNRPALIDDAKVITFAEFEDRVRRLAFALNRHGLRKGDRIFLLAPATPDLYVLLWAAFYLGLVAVFVDPSLPAKQIARILDQYRVRAVFSVEKILRHRFLIPRFWKFRFYSFDSKGFGIKNVKDLCAGDRLESAPIRLATEDEALLTFTTGSTGKPKGANRGFGILLNQHVLSAKHWPAFENEVDMPGFPMVAMQNLACGITTILPKLSGVRPADIDAAAVTEQIQKHQVSRLSGSPGFMKALTDHLLERKLKLESVKRLIVGGAQVPAKLAAAILECFPAAEANAVYGSTEAEPIAHVSLKDLGASRSEAFVLGRPIPEIEIRIVQLPKNLPQVFSPKDYASDHGEILIQGPHVIQSYLDNPEATRLTKLNGPEGLWHRTGDLGYFDAQGVLHLTGRSKDQIKLGDKFMPLMRIEKRLEEVEGVERAAIVIKDGRPLIALQGRPRTHTELTEVLSLFSLADSKIVWLEQLPLDSRHNWKINREKLEFSL